MRWTLPKLSFISRSAGVAFSVCRVAAAVHGDFERLAGVDADHALHLGESLDRASVDGDNDVARVRTRPLPPRCPACTASTRAVVEGLP